MERTGSSRSSRAKRVVATVLALSMLLASLGTSIANIALPTLAETFAAPFATVQWVVVAYLGALTLSTVIVGRLGDMFGLKRMHLVGLGIFAAGSLLCGLAPDLPFLIGARIVQGAGAAFLMTLSMALMRESAGKERLGRAMGLLGTVSALGTALGPSLGGVLIAAIGWRGIFLGQLPLALLALTLAFAALPGKRRGNDALPAFRALPDATLLPSLVGNVLVAAVMMTTLVVGPFYLGRGLGLEAAAVGLIMSVGPAISILGGVPAGRAVDALGTQRIVGLGLALLAAGTLLLALLPDLLGVTGFVLAIAVLTPGYQLFQAANNTAALADAGTARRGQVSGLLSLSRNLGLIAGASLMGGVFAHGVGTGDIGIASPLALARGMQMTFLFAAFLIVLATGVSFASSLRNALRRAG